MFCFACSGHFRDLHSFPTRRSSDLGAGYTRVTGGWLNIDGGVTADLLELDGGTDGKGTRLNSSHAVKSYGGVSDEKQNIPAATTLTWSGGNWKYLVGLTLNNAGTLV